MSRTVPASKLQVENDADADDIILVYDFSNLLFRCHSYDWGETGSGVCRLSHHT